MIRRSCPEAFLTLIVMKIQQYSQEISVVELVKQQHEAVA